MGILDAIFPTPATQQSQLNTIIAKQVVNVMSSKKFSSATAITQSASTVAIGSGSKISGVTIDQVASINTAAFLSDSTMLSLKSDLKEAISNAIKNEASNMPFGQQQNVNTTISNVVDKSIETNITHDTILQLNNAINQSYSAVALSGGEIDAIKVAQKADVISTFTNEIANDISTKLIGNAGVTNVSDTKTTNFLAETIGAVGNAITGFFSGLLQSALIGPLLLFGMFLGVVLLGLYIARGRGGSSMIPVFMTQPANQSTPVGIA